MGPDYDCAVTKHAAIQAYTWEIIQQSWLWNTEGKRAVSTMRSFSDSWCPSRENQPHQRKLGEHLNQQLITKKLEKEKGGTGCQDHKINDIYKWISVDFQILKDKAALTVLPWDEYGLTCQTRVLKIQQFPCSAEHYCGMSAESGCSPHPCLQLRLNHYTMAHAPSLKAFVTRSPITSIPCLTKNILLNHLLKCEIYNMKMLLFPTMLLLEVFQLFP